MIGQTISHYRITEKLGEGGMGVVYKAEDTSLDRPVALKFLAAHLLNDEEAKARFLREAKAAAGLHHPNICPVHEINEVDRKTFLSLAFIEGESLETRIERGPLPLEEALEIGRQVADGLEAAHEKGVVHRDIKPANIMIDAKRRATIMDFGLARLTEASRLTKADQTMGTVAYMSPEQAQGMEVDNRSDIWALGVVLYEMVRGQRPFQGEYDQALLFEIVHQEPEPLTGVRAGVPMELEFIVGKCLAKDADSRYQTAGELTVDLKSLQEKLKSGRSAILKTSLGPQHAAPPSTTGAGVRQARPRAWLPWVLSGLCALFAVVSLLISNRTGVTRLGERVHFDIVPPAGTTFIGVPVFSPDGKSIAFVANALGEVNRLYIRRLDAFAARALAGTEGALFPFWSPNGRSLGFTTRNGLKRIDLAGGPPQVLYELGLGSNNGTWNRYGDILFVANRPVVIQRISETGGPPTPVTRLDEERGEVSHKFPQFLPDGRRFLFFVYGAGSVGERRSLPGIGVDDSLNTVELATLGSFERKTVLKGVSAAVYAPGPDGDSYLLYARNNTLLAQRFDESAGEVFGEPLNIAFNVGGSGTGGFMPNVSASPSGMLVYKSRTRENLAWFDRQGNKLSELPAETAGHGLSLSTDEKRLALYRIDAAKQTSDIWIANLEQGVVSRFTFLSENTLSPVWSPDGKKVAFTDAQGKIYEKDSNGGGEPRLLSHVAASAIYDWSPDGRYLLAQGPGPKLFLLDRSEGNDERRTVDLVQNAVWGRFSPDGRFIAFTSIEDGYMNVYAIRVPPGKGKWQISRDGGKQPHWRRDGNELFFLSRDSTLMAVELGSDQAAPFGVPRPLFGTGIDVEPAYAYAASGDGQRFLIPQRSEEELPTPLTVVLNWFSASTDRERD